MAVAPFIYVRKVRWADTDAAKIVFTPRFIEFGLEALEAFFETVLERPWYGTLIAQNQGSPFVRLEMDFLAPAVPGDDLALAIFVRHIGGASIHFDVKATSQDGLAIFNGRFICCIMDEGTRRAVEMPQDLRDRLCAYQASSGMPESDQESSEPK